MCWEPVGVLWTHPEEDPGDHRQLSEESGRQKLPPQNLSSASSWLVQNKMVRMMEISVLIDYNILNFSKLSLLFLHFG